MTNIAPKYEGYIANFTKESEHRSQQKFKDVELNQLNEQVTSKRLVKMQADLISMG